ncbi:ATP synthase subunit d [Culex quinquefasciatus]|uniref:ATP synthase subunit d n=1 Tax=Culex quinquefasciatus TaxID=7176 RepID=B0X7Q2_CULQU|nr:ATP synthase subunit d [Culex quinquefasciatus]|eukprot:XP_001865674.1 ATP synthase subunit d [Culex quinquefasciatus]
MSSKDRIPIFPSRGAQMQMKARLPGAHKGHGLLKKKADALQMRFRMILSKIIETKTLMGEVMKEAAFSLAEAKFLSGDFNQVVLQNVTKAQIKIRTKRDNVAGVTLPVFESYQDGSDTYELTGLAKGGQQMQKLKKNYQSAVKLLVELASLQTSASHHRPTGGSSKRLTTPFQARAQHRKWAHQLIQPQTLRAHPFNAGHWLTTVSS